MGRILIWDWPVRLGHWLLVAAFATAWLTGESELWRNVHMAAGFVMATVITFRLVWGLIGSRYARFRQFVRSPKAAQTYLKELAMALIQGKKHEHGLGHNPAGAYAIVGLLSLGLITAASGWATANELGGAWLEKLHEFGANALLLLVVIHLAGVITGSYAAKENLVRAMLTGRQSGPTGQGIAHAHWGAALILLALAGAAAVFLVRWS